MGKPSPSNDERKAKAREATRARRARLREQFGPDFRKGEIVSRRERRQATRAKWLEGGLLCAFCGGQITELPPRGLVPVYCSAKCRFTAHSERRLLERERAGKCASGCGADRPPDTTNCRSCLDKAKQRARRRDAELRRLKGADRLARELADELLKIVVMAVRQAWRASSRPMGKKRARVEALRVKILPMVLGEGDRRDDCVSYSECLDRLAKAGKSVEGHCPVSCAQYTTISRYDLVGFEGSRRPYSISP